jgi:hypothetical protein
MPHQKDGAPEIYSEYTESDLQGELHEYQYNILSGPNAHAGYSDTWNRVNFRFMDFFFINIELCYISTKKYLFGLAK